MIELTPLEIAHACGARLVSGEVETRRGDRPRKAVVDSRAVEQGDLFFGLAGEREDGGAFAAAAIDAGAWGVVVTPGHAEAAAREGVRVFAATDPLGALGGLASRWLQSLRAGGCRVVGITGSTGKTSTKDILLSMLAPVYDFEIGTTGRTQSLFNVAQDGLGVFGPRVVGGGDDDIT